MKRDLSIPIKTAFLLILYFLNMFIGFACAMHCDMGFNHEHHHADEINFQQSCHHHNKSNHHDEPRNDHHKSKDGKDNCCNDKVIKLILLDKSVPQSFNALNKIWLTTLVYSHYLDPFIISPEVKCNKYFARTHPPPIQDIRVAIQSFQI